MIIIRIYYIILLIISINLCSKAQQSSLEKNEYLRYIKMNQLLSADENEYLINSSLSINDSIKCLFFNSSYWFVFMISEDKHGKVFAFNTVENRIIKVSDSLINMYSYLSTDDGFGIFDQKLFLIYTNNTETEEGTVGRITMDIFDSEKYRVDREILLENNAWFHSIYTRNDTLCVEVQPMEAELNVYYFFLFWMPRGTPSKYNFTENGDKIRYTFDREFNIIKKETIKE